MALQNDGGMVMPVQPMNQYAYGGYPMYVGNGFGNGFGSDFGSIIILFLFAAMFGGFGNGWGGGNNGGGMFPWLMTGQAGINANTNAGFDNAALSGQLNGIQGAITSGFSSAEVAACGRAMDTMQATYQSQMAAMERSFDEQSANAQGFNTLGTQIGNWGCENRLASANLDALIRSENCDDRAAVNAGVQRILDQMRIDRDNAQNEKIAELQRQLSVRETVAQIVGDNTAQTQYIVNRVAPYPIPAYPVGNPYGYGYGYSGFYGNGNFGGFNPFGNVGFGNGSF